MSEDKKCVLVVEDDPDSCLTIAQMLRLADYRVRTAADRDEAAIVLQSCHVDIMLLDFMMPGESASTFLQRVRWNYPNVRVILLTADCRVEAISQMLGISEFVAKPIMPEKLLEVLATA